MSGTVRDAMKKFAGLVVACLATILAAASFVPGFWSWMPGGIASSARQLVATLPQSAQPMLLTALNLPEARPGEAKPATNAASGGGGGGPG
ncbi:MAG TPA: hypothetical protein PLQ11_10825, partial [Beijerinckiaceae bacterium]|nr:hypothetical protein [Beijerinckiaceae bacterium]